MKHIRNWKLYRDKVSLSEALEVLQKGSINLYKNVAIQNNKTNRFYDKYTDDIVLKPTDVNNDWMILVPDDDKEQKNEKLRKLVKDSNCSGLNYDKIDNMTIHEIFRHIVTHVNEDQEYRWLLAFYKNEIYKTK
ncbi:MAG: hypothetical protein IJH39_08255 [Clostridia bacterium]|nr:hypothetical protein [Clostridia bacterium]